MEQILANWQNLLWTAAIMAIAVVAGLIIHKIAFAIAMRVALRTTTDVDQLVVEYAKPPARLAIPLLAIVAAIPAFPVTDEIDSPLRHAILIGLILTAGWFASKMVDVLGEVIATRYRVDTEDNLMARRVRTQFQVTHRILDAVTAVIVAAAVLMTFPNAWRFGAGLFASAGAAGLVIGLAARPVLENLLAGIQIAMTEPIRIDDVVIVEGEWGRIEEVGAAYVVVKIWDQRRLIVPLSHFIQKPFQNWTRTSAEILGTVFFYADYSVPVEEVRAELRRVLEASGMWDGKVSGLVVTNTSERTIEMRALMSAPNASIAWDLRCHVREKIVAFLQKNYAQSLPTIRAELHRVPATAA